jgi:hypothetical protein
MHACAARCRTVVTRLVAVVLFASAVDAAAQAVPSTDAASPCVAMLADLNAGLQQRRVEAMLAAAALHENGRCVAKDDAKAVQYLGEAAKAGSRLASTRLARRFGRGWGVPQSYANAGAWIAGKGASDERIDAWDYSVGYAGTVVTELLAAVRYPTPATGQPTELSFVIEVDALNPTRIAFRTTSEPAEGSAALAASLEAAFRARVTEVLTWLAPPDRRLIVPARVAVPVKLHYVSAQEVAAYEGDPILR